MAIRYDKKLNQEINRTIRNFNQKIARLEKQERDLLLPTKINKKSLKQSVTNRNELKRKLKELQRYSKRGVEETITTKGGVTLSKYELQNIKRENQNHEYSGHDVPPLCGPCKKGAHRHPRCGSRCAAGQQLRCDHHGAAR